jgi:hypothetical protein
MEYVAPPSASQVIGRLNPANVPEPGERFVGGAIVGSGVGEFVGVWGSGVAVGVYVGVTVGVTVPVGSVAVMMTESDVPQSLQFPGPWTKNGLPVHA